MEMIREYADWFYLIGAVLFILTLRGLSGPKTAIAGNRYGMIAMAIAVVTTFFVAENPVVWMIIGAMVLGAIVGIARARTLELYVHGQNPRLHPAPLRQRSSRPLDSQPQRRWSRPQWPSRSFRNGYQQSQF